jgi:hypothetical protein
MRIKALAIAAALGLLGIPGLANAIPAASTVTPPGISQQPDILPVQWGPGPWPGPPVGPNVCPGPWGPVPCPGPPVGPNVCPSPWGPVPCPGPWGPVPWPGLP